MQKKSSCQWLNRDFTFLEIITCNEQHSALNKLHSFTWIKGTKDIQTLLRSFSDVLLLQLAITGAVICASFNRNAVHSKVLSKSLLYRKHHGIVMLGRVVSFSFASFPCPWMPSIRIYVLASGKFGRDSLIKLFQTMQFIYRDLSDFPRFWSVRLMIEHKLFQISTCLLFRNPK